MKYLRILPRRTEEYLPRAAALTSRPQICYIGKYRLRWLRILLTCMSGCGDPLIITDWSCGSSSEGGIGRLALLPNYTILLLYTVPTKRGPLAIYQEVTVSIRPLHFVSRNNAESGSF